LRHTKNIVGIALIILMSVSLYVLRPYLTLYLTGMPKYLGVFMISFIGAVSVIFPIPYTVIIFLLASMKELDPSITALVGGLGSGLGEFTGWVMGRFMSKALESTKYMKQINALVKLVTLTKGKYIVPLILFIFALTPLPDDLLFIALGMLKYKLHYALIPCIIGKIVMIYFITLFGRAVTFLGESIGLSENYVIALSTAVLIVMVLLMLFVRWDKILEKYIPK